MRGMRGMNSDSLPVSVSFFLQCVEMRGGGGDMCVGVYAVLV
jgi:hypothetical protein